MKKHLIVFIVLGLFRILSGMDDIELFKKIQEKIAAQKIRHQDIQAAGKIEKVLFSKDTCNRGYYGDKLRSDSGEYYGSRWEAYKEEDSKYVGSIQYHTKNCICGTCQKSYSDECSISFLSVDPQHRNQGIGKSLFALALQSMRNSGCKQAAWESTSSGEEFYKKQGARRQSDDRTCLPMFINLDKKEKKEIT